MRTIYNICIAVTTILAANQSASAAFSFILSPANTNLVAGGSQLLTVSARETTAGAFGTQFQMSAVSNTVSGSGNITFTGFTPFIVNTNVYTATSAVAGNPIGEIIANVSLAAVSGNTATVFFNGTMSSNNGGLVNQVYSSNQATIAVPEPTSLALVGLGLGCALYRKRRVARGSSSSV